VRQDEPVTRAPVLLPRRLAAEPLGSAFLAAIVTGSGIATQRLSPSGTGPELLENPAVTAAGLFTIILKSGPASGAHLNPVVSFAGAALGGLPWKDAAGCVTGAIAVRGLYPALIPGQAAGIFVPHETGNGLAAEGGARRVPSRPAGAINGR
jgi:hypothetical protein